MQDKRVLRSVVDSLSRLHETIAQVATDVKGAPIARQLNKLSKPNSPSSALRKAGVALIVGTPDPITAVPGVALVATSYVLRRKDPTKLDDLAAETKKILRDIRDLRL